MIMKRVYFVFGDSPGVDSRGIVIPKRGNTIGFSTLMLQEELIYDMLMTLSPEFPQVIPLRNFELPIDQSVRLRDQLFDWLLGMTKELPDAEPTAISVFPIGNRNVYFNLRDIRISNIHTYWKVYDILRVCISEGKPTLVSILDDL